MVFKKKIPFKWEKIVYLPDENICTWRARVYGGWLVRNECWNVSTGQSESMVFISDPNWEWSIDTDRNDIIRKELKDIESTLHNLKNRQ